MASVVENLIDRVVIESAWGPTYVVNPKEPPSQASLALQRFAKPKVSIFLTGNADPAYVWAPYGEPGPTKWPIVQALAIGGAIGLGLLIAARLFGKSNFLFKE